MTWQQKFTEEWEQVTAELRKYDLTRVRLVAAVNRREDLRELLEFRYGGDADYAISMLADAVGISRHLFNRRCRGDCEFTDAEREKIICILHMTDEEIEKYL